MRDKETGSWWQQVSGECIFGEFKGQKLKPVLHDELTFRVWKRENPNGRVLRPDAGVLAADNYESADWEQKVAKMPVNVADKTDTTLAPRELIVGVTIGGVAKAYPLGALEQQSPIIDRVGNRQIVVILSEDRKSVRAFEAEIGGRKLEFFAKPDQPVFEMIDAQTGSTWDFSGKATNGELAGKQLTKIQALKDYWFDWKIYNSNTTVYSLGNR